VNKLLNIPGVNIDDHSVCENVNNDTIYHMVCYNYSNPDVAHKFLNQCPDINITNNNNETPLLRATLRMPLSTIKILIDLGADPSIVSTDNENIYHYLACNSNVDVVEYILSLDIDVDINQPDDEGDTPLLLAIYYCNIDTIRLFIEFGADMTAMNDDGDTILTIAQDQHLDEDYPDLYHFLKSFESAESSELSDTT